MNAVERLSGVDRAWLLMDRPTNPMMIVGLMVLEEPLAIADLRALISERFLQFERFRCVPIPRGNVADWAPCRGFDVEDHVLSVALPAHASQAELEALVGELASTPLNPSRPLWTFHLVERFDQGSAVIVRIHHCYADGMALVQVLLSLTEHASRGRPVPARERRAAGMAEHGGLWPQIFGRLVGGGAEWLEKGLQLALQRPAATVNLLGDALGMAGELAHLAALPADPATRLKQPLSGVRHVAWAPPVSLQEVKTIGKVLGCTVNDVLVSSLAGALGRYLAAQGDEVEGLSIRAAVPIDLRRGAGRVTLGNRFGLLFLDLPVGIRHPLERLYAVHRHMQSLKGSPQALVVLGLLFAVGSLPAAVEEPLVALFSSKASLVASNLAGPQEPLTIGGALISQLLFWVPQSGSMGTGVSMLTYNGQVQFGVIADRDLISRPADLVELIIAEFERLVYLVLLGGCSLTDSDSSTT